MQTMMKAAQITHYKQAIPAITQVPVPSIGPHDVLVKVVTASINPIDLKTQAGGLKMLLTYRMPLTLGSDLAGIVVKTGAQVTRFKVGAAVYGRVQKKRIGTFAEYIAVTQNDLALKPKKLSFAEAAALPLVSLTSYQALHDILRLQPGQKVLIQGGAGGIGTIAIQIAKMLGAYVATTASPKNFDLVRDLGADQVIDYHTTPFQTVLQDYDAVFDTRGGQALRDAFQIVKPGGQIVSISDVPTGRFARTYGLPLWKQLILQFATRRVTALAKQAQATYTFLFMRPDGQQLATLTPLFENGTLKSIIDRVVPFDDLSTALHYAQAGHATGKIIIQIATDQEMAGRL